MKASVIALALAGGAQLAAAHTTVWNILVNGKDQGVGKNQGGYIDHPPNNSPVTDVNSKAMECNVAGVKAAKSVSVNGGDKIAFQWHHDYNTAADDIIDPSHNGPIMVYISKKAASLSWTKIWEDTFDGKTWAVAKLIAGSYNGKKGQHEVTLPKLTPGDYVLRPEINALHEGFNVAGAQFYMECIHITVGGSGTVNLPAGVSFPGAYKATDAGVHFDLYKGATSYPPIGPKVWNGASSGSAPAPAPAPATPTKAPTTTTKPATPAQPAKTTLATVAKPAATPAAPATGGATAQKWGQCGGQGYTGPKACASGSTCQKQNDYYSQCL